ncbi:lasso peptide isopeptide bond-forming cyclase [soil metagenome]
MSGIVGILHENHTPVDRELLLRMTGALAFRGPDAQEIWADGPVGLGHALLRTTDESATEHQPCSIDSRLWITADVRLDDREALVRKLVAEGRRVSRDQPDVELLLHAYRVWGDRCLEHLLGDFAFAIWDAERRRLFCARDHMGVKPFYYARVPGRMIFSNTLDCVRLHPSVSDTLDDLAIGEFLVFGAIQKPDRTAFANIRRLPAGHRLVCSDQAAEAAAYWSLPIEDPLRYRRSGDYIEHFRDLFDMAVLDRMRTDRIALEMSGGLDSTSVAATAVQLGDRRSGGTDLRAFTVVFEWAIPDREGEFAERAAAALGVPLTLFVADNPRPSEVSDLRHRHYPEPHVDPFPYLDDGFLKLMHGHGRVVLAGQGGDLVLSNAWTHGWDLLRRGRLPQFVLEAAVYALMHRRLPKLGARTALRRARKRDSLPARPAWLNPELVRRLDLIQSPSKNGLTSRHPTRPELYEELTSSDWPGFFESLDPGWTLRPLEYRYPLFDLRLVRYLLRVPPHMRWFHKNLLREAMKDRLPAEVRLRRKEAMAGNPLSALLKGVSREGLYGGPIVQQLFEYVNPYSLPTLDAEATSDVLWIDLRIPSLNRWLKVHGQAELGEKDEST